MAVYVVRLPADNQRWRPPLFPGSQEAADANCSCPIEQPWPGQLAFDENCPIHELQRVTQ